MIHFAITKAAEDSYGAWQVSEKVKTYQDAEKAIAVQNPNLGCKSTVVAIIHLEVWVLDPIFKAIKDLMAACQGCAQWPFTELLNRLVAESFKAGRDFGKTLPRQ